MLKTFLAHVLAGMIVLAILGLAGELLGPTMTAVVSGSALVGALLRPGFDRYRQAMRDRRMRETMNRNRARYGMAPIGRASRPRLSFPDRPIVPTRDAHFGE